MFGKIIDSSREGCSRQIMCKTQTCVTARRHSKEPDSISLGDWVRDALFTGAIRSNMCQKPSGNTIPISALTRRAKHLLLAHATAPLDSMTFTFDFISSEN